jgi:hypothetical protein
MDALKHGDLSIRKAHAVGKAEQADPQRGAQLLGQATNGHSSVREIEQDSARIVNAASGETEQARAERIRRNRSFRIGSNGDGSSWAHLIGPTVEVARLEAALKPLLNDIFLDAREQGRREHRDAYAFDALMALTDRAAGPNHAAAANRRSADANGENAATTANGNANGEAGDGWEFAKVIVRADVGALDRGHVRPGEVCEIAGQGPVPVDDVWKMIDGGAFVAGIVTDGTDIVGVRHLGRHPTVLQRTVLEWETAGTCAVVGCTNAVRIEIDHVDPWASSKVTQLEDLAGICSHCHDLKTHRGYTLGPRLPNGKRRLIPPGEPSADHAHRSSDTEARAAASTLAPRPPIDLRAPGSSGEQSGRPSSRPSSRPPDPQSLFDTG